MRYQASGTSHSPQFDAASALECMRDGFLALDRQWRHLYVNSKAAHLLGRESHELVGKTYLECFPELKGSRFHLACWKVMDEGVAMQIEEFQPDFERWLGFHINPMPGGISVLMEDISDRKASESQLRSQQEMVGFMLDTLPINIYLKDHDGRYLILNKEAARTAGVPRMEALGKSDFDLFPPELARAMRAADRHVLSAGQPVVQEGTANKDGEERHILAGMQRVELDDGRPKLLGFSIDITARKNRELEARRLLTHDPVTGLPNRSLLHDRLRHAAAHARRTNRLLAVLVVEPDGLQAARQSGGQKVVDQLLQALASRLSRAVREQDSVARLAAEQFAVVLEDLAHEQDAAGVAEKIRLQCALPFHAEGREWQLSASIGISIYPKDGQHADSVLRDAELAMLAAKGEDGNRFRYFDTAMDALAFERLVAQQELRGALENGQLILHYQPSFDLSSGKVAGIEALVRWNHPYRGLLGPEHFLEVAEQSGLMPALNAMVFRSACLQLRRWREQGMKPLRLSMNLSARQMRCAELPAAIRAALLETGVEPAWLELDIDEAALAQDDEALRRSLRQLAQMGIGLALDNFGVAGTSLRLLDSLPFQALKIDGSLIRNLQASREGGCVAAAAIELAHGLGLRAVAKGVEHEEQLKALSARCCDEAQGFHLGAPLDATVMESLLLSHSPQRFALAALKH